MRGGAERAPLSARVCGTIAPLSTLRTRPDLPLQHRTFDSWRPSSAAAQVQGERAQSGQELGRHLGPPLRSAEVVAGRGHRRGPALISRSDVLLHLAAGGAPGVAGTRARGAAACAVAAGATIAARARPLWVVGWLPCRGGRARRRFRAPARLRAKPCQTFTVVHREKVRSYVRRHVRARAVGRDVVGRSRG